MVHEHNEKWTPELEHLIEAYAEALTSVQKDMINPGTSTAGSLLRGGFKTITKVHPLMKKICATAGVDSKYDQSCMMISLAEQNNRADLADSLKKSNSVAAKVEKALANGGFKAVKKAGIKF